MKNCIGNRGGKVCHALAAMMALFVLTASIARGQCPERWVPTAGALGFDGSTGPMILWDPDGAGGSLPHVVVGGMFNSVGNQLAKNIARWNGSAWLPFADGLAHPVVSIAEWDGSLVAATVPDASAGSSQGVYPPAQVWRWTGNTWVPLGNALRVTHPGATFIARLIVYQGDLFVIGKDMVGNNNGVVVGAFGKLVGSTWQPLGAALGQEFCCVTEYQGELVIGGYFNSIGSVAASNIVRWSPDNGWRPLGTGTTGRVFCVTPYEDRLLVSGDFVTAGSATSRGWAFWNGNDYENAPADLGGYLSYVTSAVQVGNLLYFGGTFGMVGGAPISGLAAWDPNVGIMEMPAPNQIVASILLEGDHLLITGSFTSVGGTAAGRFAEVTQTSASRRGGNDGFNGKVDVLALWNNHVVAAGGFTYAGREVPSGIAYWTGSNWEPIGSSRPMQYYEDAIEYEGDLIVAGRDVLQYPTMERRAARWNGQSWEDMSASLTEVDYNQPMTLATHGVHLHSASDRVMWWNGTSWIAESIVPDPYRYSVFSVDDVLYASDYNGRVFRSGTGWTFLSPLLSMGLYGSRTIKGVNFNGSLFVAGNFYSSNSIPLRGTAIRTSTGWVRPGSGVPGGTAETVCRTVVKAGNKLYVAGRFPSSIASWNGSSWNIVGTGIPNASSGYDTVLSLVVLNNEVWVGGNFSLAGGQPAYAVARFTTACCDSIDFNNDSSLFDPQDIEAFLSVYSEGPCVPATATCNDIDFNNDTSIFDPQDIASFLSVYSEGPCL